MSLQFWILTGAVYIAMVFATGYWKNLVPTSWSIFPNAFHAVGDYLNFREPPFIPGQPFDAVQKLSYFAVIFILAPVQIATGAAMSPAIIARFPWYARLFGGKQGAGSLHFLGLCAFAVFVFVHTVMVIVHGVPTEFAGMVLGSYRADHRRALAIGVLGLFLIFVFHVVITWFSLRYRRATQHLLGRMVDPFERVITRACSSRQHFRPTAISPYHRVNGYPLGVRSQITKRNCIQGWTATAEWSGVPLARLIHLVRPTAEADTMVFYAFDDKGETEGEGRWGYFYSTIPLWLARKPQNLLVLEMNGAPLAVEHGAPVRLRLETQLGFKMTKWVKGIEFTRGYRHGAGRLAGRPAVLRERGPNLGGPMTWPMRSPGEPGDRSGTPARAVHDILIECRAKLYAGRGPGISEDEWRANTSLRPTVGGVPPR